MKSAQTRRALGGSPAAAVAAALALLLFLAAPASAASCPDLVPGSVAETVAEAPPGGSTAVAYYQDAGPIYVAAEAEDGGGTFAIEIWRDGSSTVEAEAVAAAGCATTPVVDMCAASGPAMVAVVLRCQAQQQPCRVRVAVYLSACPGGAQPQAVEAGGFVSGGVPAATAAPPPPVATDQLPGGSSSPTDANGGSDGSSSGGLAGISTSTWIIVGVAAAAALVAALVLWCLCRRCRRRRQLQKKPADLELGDSKWGPIKPVTKPPPTKPQQQQFMVSSAATAAGMPPAAVQQQAQWGPPPRPPPPQQQQHVHAGAAAQGWSFAYKVAKSRLTFATEATQGGGALTPVPEIDGWVAVVVVGGGRRWEGCLMWNDDPPPGCGVRPVPYNPPGHTKGVLLWGGQHCGYLLHSVPKWPEAPPGGAGVRQLSLIEQPQTERGQSFLWVELPRAALRELLAQLQHMQALVYHSSDSRVWPWAPTDYTKWQQQGSALRQIALGPGMWHVAQSGSPPTNFFKHVAGAFGGGGWLVRTNLGTNASARVPSDSRVANITQFAPPGHNHAPYLAGSEHAKLGVCSTGRTPGAPPPPLSLVGDLNNTTAQWKRGGGAIVLRHPHLAALLREAATQVGEP